MTPPVISRWDLSVERKLAQMTANEAAIRKAYQVAEDNDVAGWAPCCDVFRLERQDSIIQLLPIGHDHPGTTRRVPSAAP
jgi:hypothetical protein